VPVFAQHIAGFFQRVQVISFALFSNAEKGNV